MYILIIHLKTQLNFKLKSIIAISFYLSLVLLSFTIQCIHVMGDHVSLPICVSFYNHLFYFLYHFIIILPQFTNVSSMLFNETICLICLQSFIIILTLLSQLQNFSSMFIVSKIINSFFTF